MKKTGNRAFILKDYLLALLIIISMLPLVSMGFKTLKSYHLVDYEINDYLSIEQLKRKLYLVNDLNINTSNISFTINDELWNLNYDGNNLYLSPGYQLFLSDVKNLYFETYGNKLYISYQKNNKTYWRVLLKLC